MQKRLRGGSVDTRGRSADMRGRSADMTKWSHKYVGGLLADMTKGLQEIDLLA